MFSWLANAWRVPELRKRVLFTAAMLAAYRLGSWIPAPGVDSQTIHDYFSGRGGTVLGLLNLFSGGALSQFAIFALGIMPYVTASIILHAVHALPHGHPRRRAGDRLCLSLPQPGRAERRLG